MKSLKKLLDIQEEKFLMFFKIGAGFVGVSMWVGILFDWSPALYIVGIYFFIAILLSVIFVIYGFILELKEIKWRSLKNFIKFIAAISLVFIIIILFINSLHQKTYEKLIQIIPDDIATNSYTLTFENVNIDYNSVGNEYDINVTVNDKKMSLHENSQIILENISSSSLIHFQLQAIEKDSIPDIGWIDELVSINTLMEFQNFSWDVLVVENLGRYTGNVATVTFNFDIKRNVTKEEVWSNIFN